jgi:hypothetical protein
MIFPWSNMMDVQDNIWVIRRALTANNAPKVIALQYFHSHFFEGARCVAAVIDVSMESKAPKPVLVTGRGSKWWGMCISASFSSIAAAPPLIQNSCNSIGCVMSLGRSKPALL